MVRQPRSCLIKIDVGKFEKKSKSHLLLERTLELLVINSDFIIINSDFITLKLIYRYYCINGQFTCMLVFIFYNFQ